MKRLVLAALLAMPTSVSAQYLQDISNADYSLRTTLSKQSDTRYVYQVQFRNEALFNPLRYFTITDVVVSGIAGNYPMPGRTDANLGASYLGNVFTGTLTHPANSFPLFYVPHWFDIGNPGQTSMRFGGSFTSTSVITGFGLLGCGIPYLDYPPAGQNHAGNTCAHAGFTGWATINLELNFFDPTPAYQGADLSASVHSFYVDRAAVSVVPEPGVWAMLAAGLIAIGFVRRRRS